MPRLNITRVSNWLVSALALGTLGVCVPRIAEAHFHLDAPPSWANQNSTGSPQKSGPCGETDMAGMVQAVASNVVTPFQPGQTISVTITETVLHPGHYRVALATDRSMLPADPPVTAGATECGSTVIDSTPEFPVLVDGALVHTAKFSGPQTIQVTLPTNITCSKCTLQVIEFMSSHGLNNPGGCFYHHCADISIGAGGAATGGTGGANAGGSAGAAAKGGAGGKSNGGNGGASSGGTTQAGGPSAGADGKAGSSSGGASNGGSSSGGTLGAGGTTGGVFGTGGASGSTSGGTIGTGGNAPNTGGALSTGGSPPTTGGVSAGGTSTGGVANAGSGAAAPPADPGCSVAGQGRSPLAGLGALAALGALGALLLRRRSH